jgi:hypothetical protein
MRILTNLMLADLSLTAQQRTTGQKLPSDLYDYRMLQTNIKTASGESSHQERIPLLIYGVFAL